MSKYIPVERESVYRKHGLEALLEDKDFSKDPSQPHELDSRRDAFGRRVRLTWIPGDNSVHLNLAKFDVEVPEGQVDQARFHTYPFLFSEVGRATVEEFITGSTHKT